MAAWQQFLVIAGAHFLALVSPGPDFFLIVRSAVVNGPRTAGGVCVGIAVANAVYIALAIAGVSLLQTSAPLFSLLTWGGCGYLAWLGWRFIRSSGELAMPSTDSTPASPSGWWKECRTGFLSGILNPKNSLFYASLFSLGFDATTHQVSDHHYAMVTDAYLLDEHTRDFLEKHNPQAMRDITTRLLEAMQRGLWEEPGDYRQTLEDMLLDHEQRMEGGL